MPPALSPRPARFSFPITAIPSLKPQGGVIGRLAVSPDGATVAYLGTISDDPAAASDDADWQLYLRRIDDAEGRPIGGTAGAQNFFFSDDGGWVGFVARGKLQVVPVDGGAPIEICSVGPTFGASWGPDDTIVFGGGLGAGLMRVEAVPGAEPVPLTSPDPDSGEILHGFPEILPDGQTVLFTVGTGEGSQIAKLSLETLEREGLIASGNTARYISAGYLAFAEGGNLRLVPFDARSGELQGAIIPAPLAGDIQAETFAGLDSAWFAVSRTGDLVSMPGEVQSVEMTLVWVDRSGTETPIEADRAFYMSPRISPDRSRIGLMRLNDQGNGEIWVMGIDGTQAFPVAADDADYNPVWNIDGEMMTYTSNGELFERSVDRAEDRVLFLDRELYQYSQSWSRDGRFLAFMEESPQGQRLWIMPRDGEPELLIDSMYNVGAAAFAPHDDWIAYVSDETGQREVFVRRYPSSDRGWQVSRGGGEEPAWANDGSELFYRSGNRMMAVEIPTETDFSNSPPVPVSLWERPYFSQDGLWTNYDVGVDGRFLMIGNSGTGPSTIDVFLDWFTEAEQRMRVDR